LYGHNGEGQLRAEYSVADAKNRLPTLIDKAQAGEQVIITRHGHPVAELRPIAAAKPRNPASYARLKEMRADSAPVGMTSVELLNAVYEDER
jgi:prevent-host-death family protein